MDNYLSALICEWVGKDPLVEHGIHVFGVDVLHFIIVGRPVYFLRLFENLFVVEVLVGGQWEPSGHLLAAHVVVHHRLVELVRVLALRMHALSEVVLRHAVIK